MRYWKQVVSLCIVSLFTVTAVSANTVKPISVNDVASYSGKTATVQGTVARIVHLPNDNCYLKFSQGKTGFTVVITSANYKKFVSAGIDLNSLEGKIITVTGLIYNDARYGLQMSLSDPASQLIIPEAATEVHYAGNVILVPNVAKYVNKYGTVQGKVLNVGYSQRSNTYFLNFTEKQGGFTVVIFSSVMSLFNKAKINPNSFKGKIVQVSGFIKFHPQYGYEILLDKPENIKVIQSP